MCKIANKISHSDQSKVLLIFINPKNLNQKKIKAQLLNYSKFKHTKSKKLTTEVSSETKKFIPTDTKFKKRNKMMKKLKVTRFWICKSLIMPLKS